MKTLFVDTETTELTKLSFANERNFMKWPRLVQIAWGVAEDDRMGDIHTSIITPEGYGIPISAQLIHGIDQERALREGRALKEEISLLISVMKRVDKLVAHNVRFDLGVLKSEALRLGIPLIQPREIDCTAVMGQAFFRKARASRIESFPRLPQLYTGLFGSDYSPCHEAASDVAACSKVYFELKKRGF